MSLLKRALFAGGIVAGVMFGLERHAVDARAHADSVRVDVHGILRGDVPNRLALVRAEVERLRRRAADDERVWPPRHLSLADTTAVADAGFFVPMPGAPDEVALSWLIDPSGRRSFRVFAWDRARVRLGPPDDAGGDAVVAWTRASFVTTGVPAGLLCDRPDGLVLLLESRGARADQLRATRQALGCETTALLWRTAAYGALLVPGAPPAAAELVLTRVGLHAPRRME